MLDVLAFLGLTALGVYLTMFAFAGEVLGRGRKDDLD